MRCRGIRGATTIPTNTKEDILTASRELLQQMVATNGVNKEEIACVLFTTSPDINAEFPAAAAREMGWSQAALMCGHEMDVPSALQRCLRILILFNTEKSFEEIIHVYLKGTEILKEENATNPTVEK
jgi:chorismate mutase